ncbi:MAG: FtsQ-type POTRA domain-containing protein [Syntrophomonadaceae bacterium]|jgi:cell division protein FtsQ|nr:FtsQ-type POTRA domain-containing protein [Syntrophomonadaceae bacterium]MDH7497269.1 FtsQ-type POTRA domain-containing protein [Syntrophomonadaceae bacterium]
MERRRGISWHAAGRLLLLAVAAVGVIAFAHSPWCTVREVTVSGNRRVSAGEIKALSGIVTGVNIFEVDTEAAARAVTVHPFLRSARVTRWLPAQIRIEVVERRPWAVISTSDSFLIIDDTGACLDRIDSLEGTDLPFISISGLPAGIAPGDSVPTRAVNAIRACMALLPADVLARVSEFRYQQDLQLLLYTVQGTEIRVGDGERLEEKAALVANFVRMEDTLAGQGTLAYVDLRFKGKPVIRYAEGGQRGE